MNIAVRGPAAFSTAVTSLFFVNIFVKTNIFSYTQKAGEEDIPSLLAPEELFHITQGSYPNFS